jgi:hypothetical protein
MNEELSQKIQDTLLEIHLDGMYLGQYMAGNNNSHFPETSKENFPHELEETLKTFMERNFHIVSSKKILNIAEEEQKDALYNFVKIWRDKNEIICPETIHQCDHVILGAYEFMEGLCEIVGYAKIEEEDDE